MSDCKARVSSGELGSAGSFLRHAQSDAGHKCIRNRYDNAMCFVGRVERVRNHLFAGRTQDEDEKPFLLSDKYCFSLT